MKKYIVPENELAELIYDSVLLNEMSSAGVNNWESFDRVNFPDDEKIKFELSLYEVIG